MPRCLSIVVGMFSSPKGKKFPPVSVSGSDFLARSQAPELVITLPLSLIRPVKSFKSSNRSYKIQVVPLIYLLKNNKVVLLITF